MRRRNGFKRFRPDLDRLERRECPAVVISPISPLNVQEGQIASTTVVATPDPGMAIAYSLGGSPPAGATIGASTGVFLWTPPPVQAIYNLTVDASECNGESASVQLTVRVFDNAPVVNIGVNGTAITNTLFGRSGRFSDPDPNDSWTGVVDFGDGSGQQPLTLDPDKGFVLNHVYTTAGTYTVAVTIYDSQGGQGRGFISVVVSAAAPPVTPPAPPTTPVLGTDYNLFGTKWASNILTWSIVPDGTEVTNEAGQSNLNSVMTTDLGSSTAFAQQVTRAFATWAAVGDLRFSQVPDGGQPIGAVGLPQGDPRFGDFRLSGYAFPASDQRLAFTYFPFDAGTLGGDLTLNTSYPWSVGGANGTFDVYSVLVHEIEVGLGIGETTNPAEVSDSLYHGVVTALGPGDVYAVQTLYGAGPYSVPGAPEVAVGTPLTPKQKAAEKAAERKATVAYKRLIAHEMRIVNAAKRQVAQIERNAARVVSRGAMVGDSAGG